jgi:signal transduction histidine kinase/ligand-binding sensor domain-containing protein/AraC-like DNA-binding protein/AmiR/NasT family two-component response regulator
MAQHPGRYTFNRLINRVTLLLLLLVLYSKSFGQSQPTFIPVASEKLTNSFVRCFYQDNDGYMWMGTTDGLVKYDGTSTRIYNHDPDDNWSICHNNINVITEDSQHRLWIGTAQGVCMYDAELDRFINIDSIRGVKNHLNNRYVTAMSFDHEGKLWIGTHGGGVNIYNPASRSFDFILDNKGVASASTLTNYITSMLSVDDLIWCGTKGGIRLFNATQKKISPLNFSQGEFPIRQVSQIVSDKARNIWLTTVNGEIHKIMPGNGYYDYKKLIAGDSLFSGSWNNTLALCKDEKGNFWIGGESSGLNYLDTKTNKITRFLAEENNVNTLPTNSIRSVYIDRAGSTWIGTFNRGAYLIDKNRKKFDPYRKGELKTVNLASKDVRGFAEDRDGNIWIAFDGAGVRRLGSRSNQLESCEDVNARLHNKYLTSIITDRQGKLWIGTRAKGVFCIDPISKKVSHYSLMSNGFGDDKVYCLYEDKKGIIWAGSSGSGLFYLDNFKQRFINLREKDAHSTIPSTAYVTSVQEDADGILWVGTMYGLYSMEPQPTGAYHYGLLIQDSKEGSLSSSGVQCVYEDHKKNLWVGTTDNGLNVKYKGEKGFRAFRKSDGLPSNTIRSIVMDFNGKLWISGNMGLSRFDPETNTFINYTRENGLTSNIFYNNACLRTSSGELFFGSNNGFDAFYPDSINNVSYDPVVHLTDLKINNQSVGIATETSPLSKHIRFTSSIELSYDQRSFAIDFVALQYGTSFSSEYCYKLDGFDRDWNCIGASHSATYTNLDPGDYVFFVRASDGQGGWSERPTQLAISIQPMPWKSWWAITIYALLVTAIAFFFIRFQIERERMKHQLTLERLAREREHELSESKTQFFTNVSHELRTPLSLILMPLESLSSGDVPAAMKERIFTAYKNTRKMMRLVNELMDFNKIESGNLKLNLQPGDVVDFIVQIASAFNGMAEMRKINFSIRAELPVIKGVFDRDKLERILVNILSNAFKFTRDGGEIKVIVNCKIPAGNHPAVGRCLELTVVDNGIGISSEEITRIFDKFFQAKSASQISNPGTGIGLALTKALVELHKGTIKAESSPDNETRFTIILPIDPGAHNIEATLEVPVDILSEAGKPEQDDADLIIVTKNESRDKPEVLLAEDNDELRKYLSTELQRDYNVIEARDGQEAFEIAKRKCPDLIISDILMPNKTGMELCRAMKCEIRTSHIPFILLTAKATIEEQIAGIETGADLYITKPFSIRYLMTHVRNVIDSRQKLYSHYSHDVYLMPSKTTSNQIDQAFLQRVIDHILEHIQDTQLGVDSIAEVFNLSRVQVYRKIKALTGKTAVEFIRIVRLKKALELMETKKFTLSEIAYQSGFNSASYFTRSFKDEYGKAPSEYLEQGSVRR